MRTYYRLLSAFVILLCLFTNTNAAEVLTTSIELDKENHILIAPEASSYQWYINGVKSSSTGRDIKIDIPGTYQVVMTNDSGEIGTSSTEIGITAEGEVYTIYLIGDSTASDWAPATYYPLTGWGQVLPYFFDSNIIFKNEAISGRSSKSFYDDHWAPIRENLKSGDLVFIQFGINDSKSEDPARYTEPFTTFQEYLTHFVTETREKGAFPVLLTTVRRNAWNATVPPTIYPAYHDYPVATRQLAGTLGVPLIDIDQLAKPLMEELGPDYTGSYWYMNLEPGEYKNNRYADGYSDQVHFQEVGAIEMARLVVEAIEVSSEDTILNRLIPHIKPMQKVAVTTNFPDKTIFTRTASYPEGLTVTLKVKFDSTWDLLRWQNEQGDTLSENDLYMFNMGADSLSIVAIFDDEPLPDCAGDYNGAAYLDECSLCVGGTTGIFPCNSETTNGTYKITSAFSELCIEEGVEITQEYCSNGDSQFWEIIKEGSDYKIKNRSSDEFLFSDNLVSGNKISTKSEGSLWRMEKIGINTFQFIPKDNTELILEVFGTTKTGQYLRLYKRHGGKNQRFTLWKLDPEDCSGFPCATSIEGSEAYNQQYKIVPNPITSLASIEFNTVPEYPVTIELFNLQGKKVFQKTDITEKCFKFGQELSKGMYIVRLTVGNDIQILKLLKN